MERPCAWSMLYLEINGNDDDDNITHLQKRHGKYKVASDIGLFSKDATGHL